MLDLIEAYPIASGAAAFWLVVVAMRLRRRKPEVVEPVKGCEHVWIWQPRTKEKRCASGEYSTRVCGRCFMSQKAQVWKEENACVFQDSRWIDARDFDRALLQGEVARKRPEMGQIAEQSWPYQGLHDGAAQRPGESRSNAVMNGSVITFYRDICHHQWLDISTCDRTEHMCSQCNLRSSRLAVGEVVWGILDPTPAPLGKVV